MWNASSCNKGGFPQIQVAGGAGSLPTFSMVYASNSVGIGECGELRPETSAIIIYPRVRLTATSTTTYSCGPADVVAQSIAHELGHALGVGDTLRSCLPGDKNSSCRRSILSCTQTGPRPSRRVAFSPPNATWPTW